MDFVYHVAAEGPNGVHLASDINEVIWGSIAFFIVAGLIVWKAGPLIAAAMRDRTARIEAELDEAKAARTAAEAALQESSADLPDVSAEEARIRAEAEATAEKLKADLIAKAEADAEAIRERGRSDVTNRRRQAQADLGAEVSRLTRTSAEAVVRQGLDGSSQSDLIESYINQVSEMR
jgi:F-type H+-transporting ATPase subunit b